MDILNSSDIRFAAVFVFLVLPGFISMRVYTLIRPGNQPSLKDTLFEAAAFGSINFGLMFWAIAWFVATDSIFIQSVIAACVLAIFPCVWPFVLDKALEFAASKEFINYRFKTAWDDFFSRRKACWIIVHMHDGGRLGGLFSDESYATLYPTPGHLFLQELWEIDQETGEFIGESPVSDGIILKPEDYRFLEIKSYIE